MAMFREHIALGAMVAAAGCALLYSLAYITDARLLALLFLITIIMSFWPDLDSDSGLPFHLIYGTFTVSCAGVALYYMLQEYPENWHVYVGVPLGVLAFVWVVVGSVFKKVTRHRGMFHSLPAAAIAGLSTLLLARHLDHPNNVATLFALGATAGYMSHLLLDVLYDTVTLTGRTFLPIPRLGGAMKFFSSYTWANLFTYLLLFTLVYFVLH